MRTAYVVCGPSGCGKSTFARDFVREHSNIVYISTDEIREELWGDAADQQQGDVVFKTAFVRINGCLKSNYDIMFDATNLSARRRRELVGMCRASGASFCVCYAFNGSVDDCISNQLKRGRQVPKSVVRRQCISYEYPTHEEGWDMVIRMEDYHE